MTIENTSRHSDSSDSVWAKDVIEKLASESLKEQRRSRRWGIFFKALTFLYLFLLLALFTPDEMAPQKIKSVNHTALVDVSGMIAAEERANANDITKGLRKAFEHVGTKGVILNINSPGGSPVQAAYVYDEIMRLRGLYPEIKVYAVAGDMCTSAAYYIASAADEIYANQASMVGSIGVLLNGFGFVDAMDKLGVERRLLTAGTNKGLFDPFTPIKEKDQDFLQSLLDDVHQQFIQDVKAGRGDRIKEHSEIFSGLFWSGEQALEIGLVDGLGSPGYVAREVIGETNIEDFTVKEDFFERFAKQVGAAAGTKLSVLFGIEKPVLN